MCRLLAVKSNKPVSIKEYLIHLSEIARNNKEYQGHGWGVTYLKDGEWQEYRNVNPIWEADFSEFGNSNLIIAHARSAFRDELVDVKYNMPYRIDNVVFAFNGELRGVRIKSEGEIGAQKIFNYIRRFEERSLDDVLLFSSNIIEKRSDYVRAMNILLCDGEKFYVSSKFNEDPTYFTLNYYVDDDIQIISSEMFEIGLDWDQIDNGEVMVI